MKIFFFVKENEMCKSHRLHIILKYLFKKKKKKIEKARDIQQLN